jgi:hypothetical protein
VSAAVAELVAASDGKTSSMDAWDQLRNGAAGIKVRTVTDATLSGAPGVDLPYLQIG